jgi:hypothetical protein
VITTLVAGHIGDEQRDDVRRGGGDRESPALDRGKVFPDAVHLGDRRAGTQQRFADRSLVVERDPGRGQREQRRAAAGDQAEDEIVRA